MKLDGEAFARRLLGSWRSGLVAVDEQGRLQIVSSEALRILGQPGSVESWAGRATEELLAHEAELHGLVREALAGRDHPSRAELVLASSGRTIGFTLLVVVGGGAALLFKDLTAFERASEQERLKERLAALGQMAAGLAHEIRNPLAAMEVLAGLLKRRFDAPEQLELLQDLVEEQHRIGAAVDACLAFVRPEPPERRPIDLSSVVREAAARAAERAGFAGQLDLPEREGPSVELDAAQISRAIVDLTVNAIQAMEEAGTPAPRLSVGIETSADGILLSVADNGPGIPAELQERIFSPFFTTRAKGSGVGLALVQKTIASHGGSVQLESDPESGTEFRLHLPEATS
ncbi:MAG: PAS domain-containing protein [bacterium]|nr:PAS domain-containing protein [bacterium]